MTTHFNPEQSEHRKIPSTVLSKICILLFAFKTSVLNSLVRVVNLLVQVYKFVSRFDYKIGEQTV